jgi:ABC-2 type transport system permease protein
MTGGGYQHYSGAREGRGRAFKAVYKDGVRTALGLGRGPRAKILPWLFITLLSGLALIFALVAGAANRFGGPGAAEQADLPSYSDYYGIASIMVYMFAAIVGPELLCRDRRDGVINLYLVRPLSGSDYVIARWAAFLTVMTAATWLPQFILFTGLSMGDPAPGQYIQAHWMDIPRFLLAGAVMSLYVTTLALLAASFTTRRAYAAVFLVGLFVISAPFTVGLAREIGGTAGKWISMFTLTSIPVHVNDIIFDDISEITDEAPAGRLWRSTRILWWAGWTLIPGLILWARYRRLTP